MEKIPGFEDTKIPVTNDSMLRKQKKTQRKGVVESKKDKKIKQSIENTLFQNQYFNRDGEVFKGYKRIANIYGYIDEIVKIVDSETGETRSICAWKFFVDGNKQESVIHCDSNKTSTDLLPLLQNTFTNQFYITHEFAEVKAYFNVLSENTKYTSYHYQIPDVGLFEVGRNYHFNTGIEIIPPVKNNTYSYSPLESREIPLGIKRISVGEKEAYRESIKFLKIGEKRVTYMLFAYFLSGILIPVLEKAGARMKSTFVLHGETGTRKTTVALLLSNLTKMNSLEIDSNFSDTEAYHQWILHEKACGMVLFDDNNPGFTQQALKTVSDKMEKILRAVGDGNTRRRMDVKMDTQKEYNVRSNAIFTSEFVPSNSIGSLARMVPIEVTHKTFDLDKLSKRQDNVDLTSTAIANFIEWMIENFDDLVEEVSDFFKRKRRELRNFETHPRFLDQAIQLDISFACYIKFGLDRKVLTKDEGAEIMSSFQKVINKYLYRSQSLLVGNDPVLMYLQAVTELQNAGQIKLVEAKSSNQPSKKAGWQDSKSIMLLEGYMFSEVKRYWAKQGVNLGLNSKDIYKLMYSNGILEVNNSEVGKTYTKKCSVLEDSSKRVRALVIDKEAARKYLKDSKKDECNEVSYKCDFIKELDNTFQFKFLESVKKNKVRIGVSENGGEFNYREL